MDDHNKGNTDGGEPRLNQEDREFSAFHEIIEDNLDIPAGEINSHRRAFNTGLSKAEQTPDFNKRGSHQRKTNLLLVTPRQWMGYSAAAVVLVAALIGAFWYASRVQTPQLLAETGEVYAVSGMFGDLRSTMPGFNRFRTSNRGIAVPGVSVELRSGTSTPTASLFGETAWAQRPQTVPTTGELVFKLNGVETGSIDLGQVQPDGQFVPVELDQAGQLFSPGTKVEFPIAIAPGETQQLNDTMQVTLDRSAPGPWQGELVHDLNWPDIFRFGNVVEGIFYFDGPATNNLRFTKAMSSSHLSHLTDEPLRVKVIAERLDAERISSVSETTWHSIPSGNTGPGGVAEPVRAKPIPGGFAVTWPVDVAERYALLSPPGTDGRLEVLHMYDQGSTAKPGRRHVIPSGFKRPQNGRWNSRYSAPGIPQTRLTELHQSPVISVDLDTPNELAGREAIEIFTPQRDTDPGEFTAVRYDFTYSEFTEYGPIQLACPSHAGQYELVNDPATGVVKLAGDLELINGAIEWDLDADYVIDGTGASYTIEVHPLQVREIAVYFSEQNGSRLRLKTSITLPVAGTYWHRDNCPAMFAVPDQPLDEVHVLSMIQGSMQPPYPAKVLACGRLIPYIVVKPSPEYLNRPLDRLAFTVNGSAGWGSVGDIYFDPYVFPARLSGPPGSPQFETIPEFFGEDNHIGGFSFANASIDAHRVLDSYQAGGNIREYFTGLISPDFQDYRRRDTFSYAYKFDTTNPPSNEEIARNLQDFIDGEFYSLEHLTGEDQQLEFTIDLQEKVIRPGQVIVIGLTTETQGAPVMGQWNVYSGGADPARIEIKAVGSEDKDVHYFDFSPFQP